MVGSVMFQELQEEIAAMSDHVNFRSQMFDSEEEESSQGKDVESFQPVYFDRDFVAKYAFKDSDFSDDSLV